MAPRTGTEIDISEIQVICWDAESTKRDSSTAKARVQDAIASESPKTPLYEAFTQNRGSSSSSSAEAGPSRQPSNPQLATTTSVLDRPRVISTRLEPEVPPRIHSKPSTSTLDTREELRSPETEASPTKKAGPSLTKRKPASSRQARPTTAGEPSSKAFYRTDTMQSVGSVVSLTSVVDDVEHIGAGSKARKGSFGLAKKASMHFFRKAKSPSTADARGSSESSGGSHEDHQPHLARRSRSSSMTSLSSAVFNLRTKEKPPSLPISHHGLTGGSVGRHVGENRPPTSWKPASASTETSPQIPSLAYASETELSGSKEQADGKPQRSKARSAIARARSIKKAASSHRAKSGSEGSTATSPTVSETAAGTFSSIATAPAQSFASNEKEVLAERAVTVSSPGLPTVSLPGSTSSNEAQQQSLNGLMATKLFQQLGPPPSGLDASAFERRVEIVLEYIDSRCAIAAELAKKPHSPTSPRSSLPPPSRQPILRRGLSVASTEDEFDKIECQFEQEMLQMLARGACERSVSVAPNEIACAELMCAAVLTGALCPPVSSFTWRNLQSVEELKLDAVFLEARRRTGVGHARTHFQLFSDSTSTASPLLTPDGRGWANGAGLGTSPRMTSSGVGAALHGDTLTGLAMPLRPAPRRRKRPTTAPETQGPVPGFGHLPPSPPAPQFGGAASGTLSAFAGTSHFPRSPAPSFQSMQASDDSHDYASRDGHGLGFEISFSARSPPSAPLSHDHHSSRSSQGHGGRGSGSLQSSVPPPSLYGSGSGSGTVGTYPSFYRRGSSDRDSSSSHTTRSVRSPMTTTMSYGRWSSRLSAGTRNSQDTNETADTTESTLAGGSSHVSAAEPMALCGIEKAAYRMPQGSVAS
ncbi:uncharacterized protein PSFLO_04685 [Pseudozyma flocculosa]|uniref:Uncharacterized protein n=1 Tax=Pseudozyma flocculosa TaxID=84751 RepID=A0A5C3F5P8_9BASI|nr:uncharacterized protein PSFLO_04685 [Pseudozyma flocculosa]